jgi:hypothetical protein
MLDRRQTEDVQQHLLSSPWVCASGHATAVSVAVCSLSMACLRSRGTCETQRHTRRHSVARFLGHVVFMTRTVSKLMMECTSSDETRGPPHNCSHSGLCIGITCARQCPKETRGENGTETRNGHTLRRGRRSPWRQWRMHANHHATRECTMSRSEAAGQTRTWIHACAYTHRGVHGEAVDLGLQGALGAAHCAV